MFVVLSIITKYRTRISVDLARKVRLQLSNPTRAVNTWNYVISHWAVKIFSTLAIVHGQTSFSWLEKGDRISKFHHHSI